MLRVSTFKETQWGFNSINTIYHDIYYGLGTCIVIQLHAKDSPINVENAEVLKLNLKLHKRFNNTIYQSKISEEHSIIRSKRRIKFTSDNLTASLKITVIYDERSYIYNETFVLRTEHLSTPVAQEENIFLYNISLGHTNGCSGDHDFLFSCQKDSVDFSHGENGLLYLDPQTICHIKIEWLQLQYNQLFEWSKIWDLLPGKQILFRIKYDTHSVLTLLNKSSSCNILVKLQNPISKEVIHRRLYSLFLKKGNLLPEKKHHNHLVSHRGSIYSMHTAWYFPQRGQLEEWVSNVDQRFVSWIQAEADCQNRSGHLVTIYDKAEMDIILDLIPHDHFVPAIYTGMALKVS